MSTPVPNPDYAVLFHNSTKETFKLVSFEIHTDGPVYKRPRDTLGPGEGNFVLSWDFQSRGASRETFGRVKLVTPSPDHGPVGEPIIFGVGLEALEKVTSTATYLQAANRPPAVWVLSEDFNQVLAVKSIPPYAIRIQRGANPGGPGKIEVLANIVYADSLDSAEFGESADPSRD